MATSDDLDVVIEQCHRALDEFVKGNTKPYQKLFSRKDDASLGNPFGPFSLGWNQVLDTMERAAAHYKDGEVTGVETIAKYVTPDLAYTAEVERISARIGGREDVASVALRTTTVFRPEDGTWKVVHRHADPITTAQPADSVIQK